MSNEVRNYQGTECWVSTAAISSSVLNTAAAYNANAFTTANRTRYKQAKNIQTLGGTFGVQRGVSVTSVMDSDTVLKLLVDSRNHGQVTLSFVRDDNDGGQEVYVAAAKSQDEVTTKLRMQVKNADGVAHGAGDNAVYLVGLVTTSTNPGGANSDFAMLDVTIELTREPVYADDVA